MEDFPELTVRSAEPVPTRFCRRSTRMAVPDSADGAKRGNDSRPIGPGVMRLSASPRGLLIGMLVIATILAASSLVLRWVALYHPEQPFHYFDVLNRLLDVRGRRTSPTG